MPSVQDVLLKAEELTFPITYMFDPFELFSSFLVNPGSTPPAFSPDLLGFFIKFKENSTTYNSALTVTPVTISSNGSTENQDSQMFVLKNAPSVSVLRLDFDTLTTVSPAEVSEPLLYTQLEQYYPETGLVMFTTAQLEYLMRYSNKMYLSGCHIDAFSLMDANSPEREKLRRGSPYYSLKIEAVSTNSAPDKGVRAPSVFGSPCLRSWYT